MESLTTHPCKKKILVNQGNLQTFCLVFTFVGSTFDSLDTMMNRTIIQCPFWSVSMHMVKVQLGPVDKNCNVLCWPINFEFSRQKSN